MITRLITPPESEPVSLVEMKVQLRVTHAQHDALIGSYITAAREQCEHILNRSIMPQVWEKVLDCFPSFEIPLYWPALIAVDSIKYLNQSGVQQTLDASQYREDIDNEPGKVTLAPGCIWPSTLNVPNSVRVRYQAGYADAATVPASIKNWIILAVEYMYDRCNSGEQDAKLPEGFFSGLLDRYRVWSL